MQAKGKGKGSTGMELTLTFSCNELSLLFLYGLVSRSTM